MNYSEAGYKLARQLALDLHTQNHFRLQSLLLFGLSEDTQLLDYVSRIYGIRKSWRHCIANGQPEPLGACLVRQLRRRHYDTPDQRLELFASLGMVEYVQNYLERGTTAYLAAARAASQFGHPEVVAFLLPQLNQRDLNICFSAAVVANQPAVVALLAPRAGAGFRLLKLKKAILDGYSEVAHILAASLGNPGLVAELIGPP